MTNALDRVKDTLIAAGFKATIVSEPDEIIIAGKSDVTKQFILQETKRIRAILSSLHDHYFVTHGGPWKSLPVTYRIVISSTDNILETAIQFLKLSFDTHFVKGEKGDDFYELEISVPAGSGPPVAMMQDRLEQTGCSELFDIVIVPAGNDPQGKEKYCVQIRYCY